MTKKIIILGFAAVTFLLVTILGFWILGLLYFRVSNATIVLNGEVSDESKIYRTGNGDYLLFLETEKAQRPVYAVLDDGRKIGTPSSPIPSSFTKSIKTRLFVMCLHCSISVADPPKFDAGAEISTSDDEISFRVSPDKVTVKF